ncbi:MAG: anthranilate synthase component I [Deltaproteobacteria bacterium RBG_13_65_10]|nr:MAG: anthranilate synthase component I [Deltaproteobacteria bacterium RBG_13_65_10]
MYFPSLEEFKKLSRAGNLIPVYREMMGDMETPVSAFRKIDCGAHAFLLESVEGGEKWGRYSFLSAEPRLVFRSRGREVEIIEDGAVRRERVERDPLENLRRLMSVYRPVKIPGLPRFFGGAVGYLSYDLVRFFERLPDGNPDPLGLYDTYLVLTDTIVIFDNVRQKIKVVHNTHLQEGCDPEEAYLQATRKIDAIVARLKTPLPVDKAGGGVGRPDVTSNFTEEEFCRAVERAKAYVVAGDVIQVVLSQRYTMTLPIDPFLIYRLLRTVNPSPYMFFLRNEGHTLVGSSPEVLARLEEGIVEVRPIAGTHPRGKDPEEDAQLEAKLRSDPKEIAEHIMLVDLGRNDVGRVAGRGTVRVDELLTVERYSHVMHLVSNVRAELAEGKDAFDAIRATFPAGTLSGAPKIRAMEIIDELENVRRGPYGGAVGYFGYGGNMDTAITIRTVVIQDGRIHLQVGAGIVFDSDPRREYQETVDKGRALVTAIDLAREGLD